MSGFAHNRQQPYMLLHVRSLNSSHCTGSAGALAVFEQLTASGIAVYTYDMYGHGLSEPHAAADRGWVEDWQHMVSWWGLGLVIVDANIVALWHLSSGCVALRRLLSLLTGHAPQTWSVLTHAWCASPCNCRWMICVALQMLFASGTKHQAILQLTTGS